MPIPSTYKRVSELDELAVPDAQDFIPIVDVDDLSETPTGKTKKIKAGNLFGVANNEAGSASAGFKATFRPAGTEGTELILDGTNSTPDIRGKYILLLLLNGADMDEVNDLDLLDPNTFMFDESIGKITLFNNVLNTDKIKIVYR